MERGRAWRFPRTPRVVTLLPFCGAAVILLRSEMRTGIAMVSASATGAQWNPAHWRSVHVLQRKAAKTGDAKSLGLLSLLAGSGTERVRLADQAMAKDASLTWLLYEFRMRGEEPEDSDIERAKRLQSGIRTMSHRD
jgi:hypothetical protein